MLAPIVLFVYNRCDHAEKTLTALSENTIADKSDLYIFSDGAKSKDGSEKVDMVRNLIHLPKWKKKFKSVTIIESQSNKGLAQSIITGVTKVMSDYGKVIVLEDDAVSSPDFLEFMNKSLDFYENDSDVWVISGYTFLKNFPADYKHDVFAMSRFGSYAWATWKKNWDKVDWDVSDYKDFCTDFKKRRRFNKCGEDMSSMLDAQVLGNINSWAIRFDYAMFKNNMRAIYPCRTRIKNIGYDTGTHISSKRVPTSKFNVTIEDNLTLPKLEHVDEDSRIVAEFASYFKKNILKRIYLYQKRVVLNLYRIKSKK